MNASGPSSNSMLSIIHTLFQTEGAMFLFKGWMPAWKRLQPTTILIFFDAGAAEEWGGLDEGEGD
jgi:dicarboxylate transporter 10